MVPPCSTMATFASPTPLTGSSDGLSSHRICTEYITQCTRLETNSNFGFNLRATKENSMLSRASVRSSVPELSRIERRFHKMLLHHKPLIRMYGPGVRPARLPHQLG